MIKNRRNRKGFTLIELLVVIAIIAVLAVVVVLTLNPAELLRQARDSNRLSDFATLKSALSLYSTDVQTTTPMYGTTGLGIGGTFNLFTAEATPTTTMTNYSSTSTQWSWGFTGGEGTVTSTNIRLVNGTGWIPLNLNAISSGAPIGAWPVDPSNSGYYTYIYAATSTGGYKLASHMESAKYTTNGPADVQSSDGGTSFWVYEQGTNLTGL